MNIKINNTRLLFYVDPSLKQFHVSPHKHMRTTVSVNHVTKSSVKPLYINLNFTLEGN